MPCCLKSALAVLLTLFVLPLLLLFASGSTSIANAALPSQLGIDSADEEDGDDGDDEGDEEEDEDDSEDEDDADEGEDEDANDGDDSDDAEDSDDRDDDSYDEISAETSEEYEEYNEEYAYFENSEAFVAEEYAEWSYSVELTSVSSSQYGYVFSAPLGGSYPSAKSMGFEEGDGLSYPFIWMTDGKNDLLFNVIVLAMWDNGAPIDRQSFVEIADAEDEGLHEEFPTDLVAPEQHMLGSHKWIYSAYGGGEGGSEVDVFSTFEGNKYYSFYFVGGDPGSHAQQSWDQMAAIVSSFR